MSRTALIRLLSALALSIGLLPAQTTWTGAVSSSWSNAANWSAGVPGSATAAVIAPAVNAPDTTGSAGAACLDLTVQAGASLATSAGFPLSAHGNVANAGAITGTLRLAGSGTISGSGSFDQIDALAGPYTVANVTCNRFYQLAGAALVTIQQLHALDDAAFLGAGVAGTPGSLLDSDNSISFLTTVPVTTPPETIRDAIYWTSNANWLPTSGTVIIDGQFGPQIQTAAGSHWHNLEFEAQSTALLSGDLVVRGSLNLRSNLAFTGTTIDLGLAAGLASNTQLVAMSATTLRVRNGITAAGVIFAPNAVLDADGAMTFFVTGGLAIGAGTHTISGNLSMSGTILVPPTATLVFDGSGSITVANNNLLPDVRITGSSYTIFNAIIGGDLDQVAGAGNLDLLRCRVDGDCTFAGASVGNFGAGALDANGNVSWLTSAPTTTPPLLVSCAGSWTSNANFQPVAGTVVLDGSGSQAVSMPAFHWHGLRIAATAQVATALPVRTGGELTVQGQLATAGNDVEAFGPLTVSGQLQANASARVRARAGLAVGGSLQAAAARLEVDGDCSVDGSAALGNGDHEVSGSLLVTGSMTIPSGQRLLLDGSGSIDVTPANPIPVVVLTGTDHTCTRLSVAQDLNQQSGVLRVRDCAVQGNATFQGAGLLDDGNGTLDVRGSVVIQATAPVTAPPTTIRCGGNWTADASFAPASGLVVLDGSGSQTVTMPAFRWHDLRIGVQSQVGTAQTATVHGFLELFGTLNIGGGGIQIDGKLTIDPTGTLTAAAATAIALGGDSSIDGALAASQASLTALGNVEIGSTGAVLLGSGPHLLHGSLAATGTWTVPAASETRLLGAGAVDVAAANTLPLATFLGDYTVVNLTVGNAVNQGSGRLRIQHLRCLGSASFLGTTVENAGAGLLEVAGSITFGTSSVVVTPPALIRCGGSWTSNNQFLPVSGTIELNGSQPQTMTAPVLSLAGLRVVAGASVGFGPQDVIVQRDLDIAGAVAGPAGLLEVRGNLNLAGTGSLQLANGAGCSVAMSLQNSGSIAGAGTLTMVGAGSLGGAGSFPGLRIDATGAIAVAGSVSLGGALTLAAGTLDLGASGQLLAAGDFTASGGVLRGSAGALLEVGGNANIDGASAHGSGVPDIHCDGDWRARSSFAPPTGTVFLDGPGQLQAIDGSMSFAHLRVTNGIRTLAGNVIAQASDLVVQPGATLDLGQARLELTAATATIDGTLAIGAGGTLALSPLANLSVGTGGALRLIGTYTAPASIAGTAGSGFACTIDGSITAMNYAFSHLGPNGVRITAQATIASAPRDLRSGWFSGGDAAPGACLLHLDRPVTTQLRYVRFDNAGTATFNVRSGGVGRIEFVNDGGNFTGSAHEDDPGSVIDWLPAERTAVAGFTARAAVHRTELQFATTAEVDVLAFHLQRATSSLGPWIEVAGSPLAPLGGSQTGASYAGTDLAVTDTTRYAYRLQEQLLHGELRLLGSDFARPWPQQVGSTWVVGSNGGYADLAAAVAAAAPGGTILVQAGTYAACTIDKPLRILPDGTGPVVIDTSGSRLLVQNIPGGAADVALYGLQIGGPTSPFGLEVVNCDNVVVLDGLQVTTATGVTGLRIDDCPRVAVQGCAIAGDPGMQVANLSTVHLSGGSVDELALSGSSRVVHCDVVPGSLTVAPGSTATARPGLMPSMQFAPLWLSEKPATIRVQGGAFDLYGIALSMRRDYLDLSFVFPIDMVLLLDHTLAFTMATGLLDANGTADLSVILPTLPGSWGQSVPLQVLTLRANGTGRMGTTRDLLLMP